MTTPMKLRVNAAVEAAVPVLERIAFLDRDIARIQQNRDEAIAQINATADALLVDPLKDRAELVPLIEAWWARNASKVLTGTRKSALLGGCDVGTKTVRAKFHYSLGDDKIAAKSLLDAAWSKAYVRTVHEVDKAAVVKALSGKDGDRLRAIGFGTTGGGEAFFVSQAKQDGTIAG